MASEKFNISMDTDLKKELKIYCIKNDTKPSIVIEKLVRDFLANKKEKK